MVTLTQERPRSQIVALAKGMRLLEVLATSADGASLAEIVAASGIERTSVHRILRTLLNEGFLARRGRGRYEMGPRGLALGLALSRGSKLASVAEPVMHELQAKVNEAVNLAVLEGTDVVYIARVEPRRFLSDNHEVGSRLPAYCTSLGRSILAFGSPERARAILELSDLRQVTGDTITSVPELLGLLEEIRERGYAMVSGELEVGLRCIAAPIRASSGDAVAAINISIPETRVSERTIERDIAFLLEAVTSLSAQLGWRGAHGLEAGDLAAP